MTRKVNKQIINILARHIECVLTCQCYFIIICKYICMYYYIYIYFYKHISPLCSTASKTQQCVHIVMYTLYNLNSVLNSLNNYCLSRLHLHCKCERDAACLLRVNCCLQECHGPGSLMVVWVRCSMPALRALDQELCKVREPLALLKIKMAVSGLIR